MFDHVGWERTDVSEKAAAFIFMVSSPKGVTLKIETEHFSIRNNSRCGVTFQNT
jgi:hypothetical protein